MNQFEFKFQIMLIVAQGTDYYILIVSWISGEL